MLEQKKKLPLPEKFAELLARPETEAYLRMEHGRLYRLGSLTREGERGLALALEEEHTPLGRVLVEALWVTKPAAVILKCGDETAAVEVWVYRCHIAGPFFAKKLLEIRKSDVNRDMASVWELYVTGSAEAGDLTNAEELPVAGSAEWHLDHLGLLK